MQEILSLFEELQISGESVRKTVIYLLLTLFPAIFTNSGLSVKDVLKFFIFNKNRNACKYVLLNRVNDDSWQDYLDKYVILTFGLFVLVIDIFVRLGVIKLFVLFAYIRIGDIDSRASVVILISIMVAILLMANYVGKNSYFGFLKNLKLIVFIVCEGLLFTMWITMTAQNAENCLPALSFFSLLITFSIIITVHKCKIFRRHNYLAVKVFRTIRYIILSWDIVCFIRLQILENNVSFILWLILCCSEFLWIVLQDKTGLVNVTIHTKTGEKITRDKIVQYEEDKIGYTLLDGTVEIVDSDEVERITYQRKHLIFKKKMIKKKVECELRSGSLLEFHDYTLVRDAWVEFIRNENGVREVLLMKTRDVEKITEVK